LFQKQPAVRKLLYALSPLFLFAVFFYGLKFLLISIICFAAGTNIAILSGNILIFLTDTANKKVNKAFPKLRFRKNHNIQK